MAFRFVFTAVALLAASPLAADVTEELSYSYGLNDGGRVSVDNINGKVTVIGGPGNTVEIVALKKAARQEYLDAIEIIIDHTDDAIRIETEHPSRSGPSSWFSRGESGSVSYTIRVPASAMLESIESVNGGLDISGVSGVVQASTVNGSINAQDLSSDARIDTVNGTVEATFTLFEGGQKAKFETVNGRLLISLPPNANARVSAETVHGSINGSDFGLITNKGFVGRDLDGQIGAGSARLDLSTVNGSIRIQSH